MQNDQMEMCHHPDWEESCIHHLHVEGRMAINLHFWQRASGQWHEGYFYVPALGDL